MKSKASLGLTLIMVLSLVLAALPSGAQAAPPENIPAAVGSQDGPHIEVEPALLTQLRADESTGYLIYLRDRPDLSPAYDMDWVARGRFVVSALRETAKHSQSQVRTYLDARSASYKAFWIDNVIVVESSNRVTFDGLMSFSEIEAVRERRHPIFYQPEQVRTSIAAPLTVESNLTHVNADDVWAMGYTGQGVVVANIDTGVRYTHEALAAQYRGNLGGGTFDHNYNWWDPYDHDAAPNDSDDHGSHTMGTMVGDDGGTNQIGMAPGAKWMACQGFNPGATDTGLLECAQFMTAPWDLTGANANPDLRPNVVNNSWGDCSTSLDPWYKGVIASWLAAGIYPSFSNGNASNCGYPAPPGLNTVGNPARYGEVTGVGSTGKDNGQYATHSTWGPTDDLDTINPLGDPYLKPQVLAPGVNIRSALRGSDVAYGAMGGTSMSSPHVAGLVALMWQAAPCLTGDYATTENVIEQTAVPIPYDDGTGGGAQVPNYATGWGEIDALAAVEAARAWCGDSLLRGTVTEGGIVPVADATIIATLSPTEIWQATSNVSGTYEMRVFSGTYTIEALKYGYQPYQATGVTVVDTTTHDIVLSPLPPSSFHTVDGVVTDATTGWPLYAHISVSGDPVDPLPPADEVWTDPVTGYYSITLAEGITYTFDVVAWVDGYVPTDRDVGPLTGDATQDFALDADLVACTAPGYEVGVGCTPPADGGLVVGDVYDANYPGVTLDGAGVANDGGYAGATVGGGFYTLFSPSGDHVFTGTMGGGYAPDIQTVTVIASDTVRQDFYLPAGISVPDLLALTAHLELGQVATQRWEINNAGGVDFRFELQEREVKGGFHPLALSGNTVLLMGEDISTDGWNAYRDALEAAGVEWDEWDLDSQSFPTASDLAAYEVLIWADESTLSPGDAECQIVVDWLISGGKSLFAASMDFLWDLENGTPGAGEHNLYLLLNTEYLGDYAGVGIAALNGVPGDPIGDGLTLQLAGDSASNGDYAQETTGAPTGFLYGSGGLGSGRSALTHYEGPNYNTVWLGVNFHDGLTIQAERNQLMENVLALLNALPDVPWLSESPISGTVPVAGGQAIDVTFDAAYVDQPGAYHAQLWIDDDTPYVARHVPVTMTVEAPASWGKLGGAVTGLGVCGIHPTPLEGAELTITGTGGVIWTVTTDVSGTYQLWLDQGHSPLTVTVSAPDYRGAAIGVMITQGTTTTVDFDLRLLQPCLGYDPSGLEATLAMGHNEVRLLNLLNTGAAAAEFELVELVGKFIPAAPIPLAKVTIGEPVGDNAFTKASNSSAASGARRAWTLPEAPDGGYILTHSASQDIIDSNSVSCNAGGWHADNSYLRTFYLPDFGITSAFEVTEVGVGIETAAGGSGGNQPVEVRLYTLNGALLWGNMTLIGQASVSIPDQALTHFSIPVSGIVPAGSTLVVEFFTPDGQAAGNRLFVGSNNLGQTAPSYLAAADCGVIEPTDAAALGFPGVHIVMNVTGMTRVGDVAWLFEDPISGTIPADSTFPIDVAFDAGVPETMQPGEYRAELQIASDAANDVPNVPVTLTVTAPDTWGKLAGTVASLGHCDVETPTPLADAGVWVEASTGVVWPLTTDISGTYQVWMDEAHSPLTLTVVYSDHVTEVITDVWATAGMTTTVDAGLRWVYPCLSVEPDGLRLTVGLGMSGTLPLTLTNDGAGDTQFRLNEIDQGFVVLRPQVLIPVAPSGPLERLGIPTAGTRAMALNPDDGIADGGFEAGTPNPFWNEYSLNFGTPLCDASCGVGGGTGPHGGAYWSWFGGIAAYEEGSVDQDVTIPAGTAALSFWLEQPVCAAAADYMEVLVDGVRVFYTDGSHARCNTVGYWQEGVDISSFADGGTHNVLFHSEIFGAGTTNFFVDDVVLDVVAAVDVPWLTEVPTQGVVLADGWTVVDVTMDAARVEQPGEYYATLAVDSDDEVLGTVERPVTMTVTPPATWGKLDGTVQGLGYCDADPSPLEGAEVLVESWVTATGVITGATEVWSEDFELGDGGLVGTNDWEWGSFSWAGTCGTSYPPATAHSGTHMWGTVLNDCYNNLGDTSVLSFAVDLSGMSTVALSWWDWYDVYETWDHGEVYVNGVLVYDRASSYVIPTAWVSHTVDLSPYVGGIATVEFRAYATAVVERAGWYIDDVTVMGIDGVSADVPVSWLVETDENGQYGVWVDEMYSPLTVTVTYPDHGVGQATGVTVVGGVTATQNFDLRWMEPCVAVEPGAIDRMVTWGMSATVPLSITNTGAVATDWDGYVIPAWLSVDPYSGTLVADTGLAAVIVRLDAATVAQPGVYASEVEVASDDPREPSIYVPVTMTVPMPGTWGRLEGAVTSLGHCDMEILELAGAEVMIEDGTVATLTTDVDGLYGYWLPAGSYTVTVSEADHMSATAAVDVFAGITTTQDFDLRWLGPCLTDVVPDSMELTLSMGTSATLPLTLTNVGAGGLDFGFLESSRGFTPHILASSTEFLAGAYDLPALATGGDGDVPWLFEDPITGTVAAESSALVDVTFDADVPEVTYPGDYMADLTVKTDDPVYPETTIPVTLHVTLPASYGYLEGTVSSLGYCDGDMIPLEGADVLITGTGGIVWALTTDVGGIFDLWLDEMYSPLTVTVLAPDHEMGQIASVPVTGTQTTTLGIGLSWLRPCAAVEPPAIHEMITMGVSTTVPMTVSNSGAYTLSWSLTEVDEGFAPLALQTTRILLMVEDVGAASWNAYRDALTAAGVSWTEWNLDALAFPTPGDLVPYDVLIWADEGTLAPSNAECQVVADWLVSSGKALFATSVDFLWDLENGTVGQGEHNLYLLFNTDYLGDYAGTGIAALEGVPGDPIGEGLGLALAGSFGSNGDYADETAGAPSSLLYGAGGTGSGRSALTYYEGPNYKTVWLGLNFHNGLTVQSERNQLMAKILGFLGAADVPWLDEDPTAGATAARSASPVTVTLDGSAPEVDQPGDYYATLTVEGDDPVHDAIGVPVTMTVLPPATWGKLMGTVTSMGYCDGESVPAEGADVLIESRMGSTWTWMLETSADGVYAWWLDEMVSPLTVTVSYLDHMSATTVLTVSAGTTVTFDAELVWLNPCIRAVPDSLEIALMLGTSATVSLDLTNGGALPSWFGVEEWNVGFEPMGPLAAGGPDGFGYRYADSNEGFGPAYKFVDISGFGTPVVLSDNDYAQISIGFDFMFYGVDPAATSFYDTVFASSNGFLSFGGGSTDMSPDPVLPNPTLPNNLIAAMWDDLVPGVAGMVYYQSFGECPYNPSAISSAACLIVQYDGYEHAGGSAAGTFEVILFRTGSILMQFADADAPVATTGIENRLGVDGLTYGAPLADELAICFAYPGQTLDCQATDIPWLAMVPEHGSVDAYSAEPMTVTFDAGVPEVEEPGTYVAELRISSHDPTHPFAVVPVTMTVSQFGGKLAGTVTGWGYCDATSETLEGVEIWIEGFSGAAWQVTADADGSYRIWLDEGDNPYTVIVAHEDYVMQTLGNVDVTNGGTTVLNIDLRADRPCISTAPSRYDVVVARNGAVTRSLTLINGGAGVLEYSDLDSSVAWLSGTPISGSVEADSSGKAVLTFDAAGLSLGSYTGILEVVHNDVTAGRSFVRPIDMLVVGYEPVLTPVVDAKSGGPGSTVVYSLMLTNNGTYTDTVDLAVSGNVWTTTVPATVGPWGAGVSTVLSVEVSIPAAAQDGYSDTVTVTVTSRGDALRFADTVLTTTAVVGEDKVYLPVIMKGP